MGIQTPLRVSLAGNPLVQQSLKEIDESFSTFETADGIPLQGMVELPEVRIVGIFSRSIIERVRSAKVWSETTRRVGNSSHKV